MVTAYAHTDMKGKRNRYSRFSWKELLLGFWPQSNWN